MTDKLKDKLHEKAEQEVEVRGHKMEKADIFKFVGLIAFFAIMVLIVVMLWPYFHELFEPGGFDRIINDVRGAGPVGFLILLGLQFLQIVVAFIPGEVVQIAAGLLYGPWIGALVILAGCVISSAFIFALVRKLGAPFVQSMVPVQYLEKFRKFEKTGKLNIIVFILFLIPGLPKDVFTYLVPLTDMRMRTFLLLSNVGRIPGIVVSTYAADGLADGRLMESVIIFAVAAVIAVFVVDQIIYNSTGEYKLLKQYQRNRLLVFLDPDIDPTGESYNLKQAQIAIGSGGLFGKGLFQGTQHTLGILPEAPTDFIFCVLAEELGFLGVMALLALYAGLVLISFRIAGA
ncbi:MAG: FtsW/RodA/SpoVE family cell cycle protein, partial [Eggerthella sp.]|nr:FtsW/RodA/SpoVE family cell cycle protein [Eggerthella sp.]